MRVRFEEVGYSVVEGEAVDVCVVVEGRIDTDFTATVRTSDITARGQLK